ncbi:MAG: FeoA domain-containing protein [Eggerthellaceae bacterium]|nr:FeoA domain-containing protein [Eggerthellaceae bacterium]
MISRIGGNLIVNIKGSRVALSSELAQHIAI